MSPRVRELIVQYRPHPSGTAISTHAITDAAAALQIIRPILEDQPAEVFIVLHLDAKMHLLGVQEVARGGLSECQVPIRSIMAAAIGERNSRYLILAHNHPSGDPTPSPDDIALTRTIIQAARVFQVEIADHIIIGAERYCSLRETGRMEYV